MLSAATGLEGLEGSTDPSPRPADALAKLAGGEPVSETEPAFPGGRRGARAAAVQALYEADAAGHPGPRSVRRVAAAAGLPGQLADFAAALVEAVEARRTVLDARIAELAPAFPADQLPPVDRNVLRVALAELEINPEAPRRTIVNEAIEIARLFGSESSPKFVNGVLGAMLR